MPRRRKGEEDDDIKSQSNLSMFGKSMSCFSMMNQSISGATALKQPTFINNAQANLQAAIDS